MEIVKNTSIALHKLAESSSKKSDQLTEKVGNKLSQKNSPNSNGSRRRNNDFFFYCASWELLKRSRSFKKFVATLLFVIVFTILSTITIIVIGWVLTIFSLLLAASAYFIVKQLANALAYLLDVQLTANLYGLFKLSFILFFCWGLARYVMSPFVIWMSNGIASSVGIYFGTTFLTVVSSLVAITLAIVAIAFVFFIIDRLLKADSVNRYLKLAPKTGGDLAKAYRAKYDYHFLLIHLAAALVSSAVAFGLYAVFTTLAPTVFALAWFPSPIIASIVLGLAAFCFINRLFTFIYATQFSEEGMQILSLYREDKIYVGSDQNNNTTDYTDYDAEHSIYGYKPHDIQDTIYKESDVRDSSYDNNNKFNPITDDDNEFNPITDDDNEIKLITYDDNEFNPIITETTYQQPINGKNVSF